MTPEEVKVGEVVLVKSRIVEKVEQEGGIVVFNCRPVSTSKFTVPIAVKPEDMIKEVTE